MTAPRTRTRSSRPRDDAAETRTTAPESAAEGPEPTAEGGCNLPGCPRDPEWRGLCSAHRQTHRGLADPKDDSGD